MQMVATLTAHDQSLISLAQGTPSLTETVAEGHKTTLSSQKLAKLSVLVIHCALWSSTCMTSLVHCHHLFMSSEQFFDIQ